MINKIYLKLKRIFPLLSIIGIACILFTDTSQLMVQLYKLSTVCLVLIAVHFIRQWMFPYIHLSDIVKHKIYGSPIASAMLFVSIIIFTIAILIITVI